MNSTGCQIGGLYLEQSLSYGIPAAFLLFTLIQWVLHRSKLKPLWLIAAVVTSLAAYFAPGMGFGLALLLIARYQGNQWLLGGCSQFSRGLHQWLVLLPRLQLVV